MKSSKIKNRREDNSWERPTKEIVSGRLVGEIKQEDERMEENSCERPTKVEENGRLVGKIRQDKEQERG